MLSRLLPSRIDNDYRGLRVAFWLLIPIVLLKLLMGFNVAGLNPWVHSRDIIQSADGIPIDEYGAEAGNLIVYLFSSWGLALFVLSLLAALALLRYRSMIPLIYLLLAIEQVGRKSMATLGPALPSSGGEGSSPGNMINWILSVALLVGLVLSLLGHRRDRVRNPA